jgi:nucleoid DNA-binding protein
MSNVKDLSRILADKRKLNIADAEKFLSLMIDVVNDGLLDNKLVKIKGLGTFKVTSVSPRESVDVNTGERILIEGRDKISFSPDNAMKELVNRPFSQFETVVVNDGVDFGQDEEQTGDDSVDETSEDAPDDAKEIVETSVEQNIEEVEQNIEEVVKTDGDNTSESYDKELEKKELNNTVKEEVEDIADSFVGQKTEEIIDQKIELPVESEKESETVDIKIEEATSEPEPVVESVVDKGLEHHNQNVMENSERIENNEENSDELEPVKNTTGINKFLVISIFALFVLSAGALCYMYNELTERNCRIESLMNRLEERKTTPKAKPAKPIAVKPEPVVKKPTEEVKSPDVINKNKVKAVSKPAVTDEYEAMNNSDPRVRTGAYKIVGVQKTLKVKAGQTLNSISRLYFGPGMECYIEVMNGKKELKEGEPIKIPELKNKRSR